VRREIEHKYKDYVRVRVRQTVRQRVRPKIEQIVMIERVCFGFRLSVKCLATIKMIMDVREELFARTWQMFRLYCL